MGERKSSDRLRYAGSDPTRFGVQEDLRIVIRTCSHVLHRGRGKWEGKPKMDGLAGEDHNITESEATIHESEQISWNALEPTDEDRRRFIVIKDAHSPAEGLSLGGSP